MNRHRPVVPDEIPVLQVDNAAVRERQVARLVALRASRDAALVARCLQALREAASGEANLVALAVDAVRAGATVGEVSGALEDVWGRHAADPLVVRGVYRREGSMAEDQMQAVEERVNAFLAEHGRRPRMLVAKVGQDGHDRGQKVVATAFADLGFDVDLGPLFATPEEVARQAVDHDVHVVGVSSLAAGHLALVPALKAALAAAGRPEILVVVGGVIPPVDVPKLKEAGAACIFGPGTVMSEAAMELLGVMEQAGFDV